MIKFVSAFFLAAFLLTHNAKAELFVSEPEEDRPLEEIDFGLIQPGDSDLKVILIRNTGETQTGLECYVRGPVFILHADTCSGSIDSTETIGITIIFAPTHTGIYRRFLDIDTDQSSLRIPLKGIAFPQGMAPPIP